jgi:hypothetical protein
MRGGAREGAGRKPGRGEKKRGRSVSLSPIVWQFLAAREGSANDQIEDTIRRMAAFKVWLKSQ